MIHATNSSISVFRHSCCTLSYLTFPLSIICFVRFYSDLLDSYGYLAFCTENVMFSTDRVRCISIRGTTTLGNMTFAKPDQVSYFLQGLIHVEMCNIIAKALCFVKR